MGRIKELNNRDGRKFSLLWIDAVLLEFPQIAEGISFAVPDNMYGQVHVIVVHVIHKHDQKPSEDICGQSPMVAKNCHRQANLT